jgi:NAD(P)-dependent dehydrogenase (short-subunit alcohol dehydrogenase family)
MALHGALNAAARRARPARATWPARAACACTCRGWTTWPATCTCSAEHLAGDERQALYRFALHDDTGERWSTAVPPWCSTPPLTPSGTPARQTCPRHRRQRRHRQRHRRAPGRRRRPGAAARQLAARGGAGAGRGLRAAGGQAEVVVFDLSDDAASASAPGREAMLEGGAVQIVVNNAGIHDDAVFPGMKRAQWHRVIDVSLNGFFRVTQPLVLPMLRTRWGRIDQHLVGGGDHAGNRGQVNYAAAKGALHSATKALSLELASRGVTVNAVAPGIIESPMAARLRRRDHQAPGAHAARRHGPTRWPRWSASSASRRGRLHHRAGDLGQRRHDLKRQYIPRPRSLSMRLARSLAAAALALAALAARAGPRCPPRRRCPTASMSRRARCRIRSSAPARVRRAARWPRATTASPRSPRWRPRCRR